VVVDLGNQSIIHVDDIHADCIFDGLVMCHTSYPLGFTMQLLNYTVWVQIMMKYK